jgi:transposase-like protein
MCLVPAYRLDIAEKAKIVLEALREQATVSDLAQRYQVRHAVRDPWARALNYGFGR